MSNNWPFVKSEPIRLDQNPELGLDWIYQRIAEDPEILGLGTLKVRDRSQTLMGACRELVAETPSGDRACAIVVKTGCTDEAQVVGALEVWGRERARYGQTPLEAVMVAEQFGPRFLNLVTTLSHCIPLQAVQMQAIRVGEAMTVIFTPMNSASPATRDSGQVSAPTLLTPPAPAATVAGASGEQATLCAEREADSETETCANTSVPNTNPSAHSFVPQLSAVADMPTPDEPSWDSFDLPALESLSQSTSNQSAARVFLPDPKSLTPDRGYWERRDPSAVFMADQLLAAVQALEPSLELDYRDNYIGLARGGQPVDFARFRPEPGALVVGLRLERNPLIELGIAQAGLDQIRDESVNGYCLRLSQAQFDAQRGPASRLMRLAYEETRA